MGEEQGARYWRYALQALEDGRLTAKEKRALLELAQTWPQGSLWHDEIMRVSRCQQNICLRPAAPIASPSERRISV
jgi:hypothetical protein